MSEEAYTRIIVETEKAKATAQAALDGIRDHNTSCDLRYTAIDKRLGDISKIGVSTLLGLLAWTLAELYAGTKDEPQQPPTVSQSR